MDKLFEDKKIALKGVFPVGALNVGLDDPHSVRHLHFITVVDMKGLIEKNGGTIHLFLQYQNELFYFFNIVFEDLKYHPLEKPIKLGFWDKLKVKLKLKKMPMPDPMAGWITITKPSKDVIVGMIR